MQPHAAPQATHGADGEIMAVFVLMTSRGRVSAYPAYVIPSQRIAIRTSHGPASSRPARLALSIVHLTRLSIICNQTADTPSSAGLLNLCGWTTAFTECLGLSAKTRCGGGVGVESQALDDPVVRNASRALSSNRRVVFSARATKSRTLTTLPFRLAASIRNLTSARGKKLHKITN